jgi:dynein heavy chain
LHSLDVSGIVGPPYACMAVSPRLGPVSGGTSVCINGLSFPQGDVKVQFFDGKNQV